ncbi:TetR/AcrR family transcriptional regulator [Arthrobacter sulfonylureivorans]|uniref:TetR/AcrR family transcriptional regulator n=1 Tax=Arthrobacter sulfonylureivorans TaxID=2486855 RepID=A0ABY3W6K2_9MICC|nr:TetR/AcrR family transcriptional regulator [Arthrobacter sulfonylureivorans]UNK45621.1 TetR/AcrR family transcriptional regulator [Arthrobacter sulfonylureivorans]
MADPLNTRDRILNAAEQLFFQQGISVTGVDRVAATAGVAIVTLYKHFGAKDNLLREVLARRLESWTRHWDEAIARATTAEDRLLAVFDAIETFRASSNQTQWCSFLATASERPAPTDGQDDPVFELIRLDTEMVTERLATLAKEAGCPDPATVSAVLLLLYNGVLSSLLRGEPSNPVEHARTAVRTIMRAGVGQPHAARS